MRHSVARTEVGGGPLRSESARLPGVTLALAAPGPLYNSAGLRSVYRARPSATRRSLTTATARLQSLAAHPPRLADYTDRATARLFRIAASVRGGKTRLRPATRIPTAQTALGDQVPGTGN